MGFIIRERYIFPEKYKGKVTLLQAIEWIDFVTERCDSIREDNPLNDLTLEDVKRKVTMEDVEE